MDMDTIHIHGGLGRENRVRIQNLEGHHLFKFVRSTKEEFTIMCCYV